MTGSSSRCATPRSQRSGRTESGPKKPTLPQHVGEHRADERAVDARPRRPPSGAVAQRVPHEVGVAGEPRADREDRGTCRRRARKIRSASRRSSARSGADERRHGANSSGGAASVKPRRLRTASAALYGSTHGAAGRAVADRPGVPRGGALCPRRSQHAAEALPRLAAASEIIVVDDGSRRRHRRGRGALREPGPAARDPPPARTAARARRSRPGSPPRAIPSSPSPTPTVRTTWAPAADARGARERRDRRRDRRPRARPSRRSTAATARSGCSPGGRFSVLTSLALGLPFRDSQCGLKAFRADVARRLFALRTIDGFGFDFEVLAAALAQRASRRSAFPCGSRTTTTRGSRSCATACAWRATSGACASS